MEKSKIIMEQNELNIFIETKNVLTSVKYLIEKSVELKLKEIENFKANIENLVNDCEKVDIVNNLYKKMQVINSEIEEEINEYRSTWK